MTTISTKSGKVIKVVSSEEEKTTLTVFFASLFCIKLQKVFVGCCTCIL